MNEDINFDEFKLIESKVLLEDDKKFNLNA